MTTLNNKDVLERINQVDWWYHAYEIVPGVMTPGICQVNPKQAFRKFDLGEQLTGKRVLEIGTWDGPYAFELESRGADVVATDIQDPDRTGFNTAKQILNSNVKYVRTSVYDLTKNLDGIFDIVLFMGVFYHLKHPIIALEQIHNVLRNDGILCFEGEYLSHYAETSKSKKVNRFYRVTLALLAYSNIPITLFYSGNYKGEPNNWHIPNIACIKAWMLTAGFDIQTLQVIVGDATIVANGTRRLLKNGLIRSILLDETQRVFGTAIKAGSKPIKEHGLV